MNGNQKLDHVCSSQARRAGYPGMFKAFLSSRFTNLKKIVQESDKYLRVVNLRRDILFDSWADVFSEKGIFTSPKPKIYSFSNKDVLDDPTW